MNGGVIFGGGFFMYVVGVAFFISQGVGILEALFWPVIVAVILAVFGAIASASK